jgi:hypothetical protein
LVNKLSRPQLKSDIGGDLDVSQAWSEQLKFGFALNEWTPRMGGK